MCPGENGGMSRVRKDCLTLTLCLRSSCVFQAFVGRQLCVVVLCVCVTT